MLDQALSAAAIAIAAFEAGLDKAIGRNRRLVLWRYAAALCIGVPIAWAVPGFHWDLSSTFGLIAGMVLYALLDAVGVRNSIRSKGNDR